MDKILFFHHGSISVGAGLCALHLLKNIPKDKYEVTVCLPNLPGDLENKILDLGYKVRKDFPKSYSYMHISGMNWPFFSINHIRNMYTVCKYQRIAENVINDEKPDVVMANSMTLFWIGKIAKAYGCKTVCFDRETFCKGFFGIRTNFIKRALVKYFDKVVFISNYDMKQLGGDNSSKICITDKVEPKIYENLDKDICRRELNLPEGNLVLYTGGPSKLKGIELVLKIIPCVPNTKFIILQCDKPVTELSLRKNVKRFLGKDAVYNTWKYIEKKNLANRVILRGRTDCVEKYFGACDLVIFPSKAPHQARPIYEAGFAKRPIIVSDFPNTKEFLNETNGWVVAPKDYKKWVYVINSILNCQVKDVDEKICKSNGMAYKNNNYDDLSDEVSRLLDTL